MRRRFPLILLLASVTSPAGAQTMLDQELRLIDIHNLLLDLPAVQAPAALGPLQLDAGVEAITVPSIDGTTGGKRQITASDHTPVFPRPRVQLGLPAPAGWRAFVGVSYIPPIKVLDVTTHLGAIEAGLAHAPGSFSAGLRAHAVYSFTRSPVTDPLTEDTLETFTYGVDLGAGYVLHGGWASWTPYAGVGVTRLHGRFRVTSDAVVLTSDTTALALSGGVRVLIDRHWEAVAEIDAYAGLLVHPNLRLAYVF